MTPWQDRLTSLLPRGADRGPRPVHGLGRAGSCCTAGRYSMLADARLASAVDHRHLAGAGRSRGWCSGGWACTAACGVSPACPTCSTSSRPASSACWPSWSCCSSTTGFDGVPRAVLVLYPFVLSALLGVPRLLYRAWKDYQSLQYDADCASGADPRCRPGRRGAGARPAPHRRLRAGRPARRCARTCRAPSCRACRCSARWTMPPPRSRAKPPPELLVIAMPSLDAAGDAAGGRPLREHRPAVPHGARA